MCAEKSALISTYIALLLPANPIQRDLKHAETGNTRRNANATLYNKYLFSKVLAECESAHIHYVSGMRSVYRGMVDLNYNLDRNISILIVFYHFKVF